MKRTSLFVRRYMSHDSATGTIAWAGECLPAFVQFDLPGSIIKPSIGVLVVASGSGSFAH